jgi:hypothetical protein
VRTWEAIARYYAIEAVRSRIAEYCGGLSSFPRRFSAIGLAGYGGRHALRTSDMAPVATANEGFGRLLENGADVCRSFADQGGTLIQLDVDYVNPTDPGEAYRDPWTCFRRLEPVYRAVHEVFEAFDIPTLAVMTGRGYHFTARAALGGSLHSELIRISCLRPALQARYESLEHAESLAMSMGAAHDGAGRLVEFICHDAIRAVGTKTTVPVTLADVPPPGRGPFICLDSTAYGDPVLSRHARCAFSSHQKASMEGLASPTRPGFVFALPRTTLSLPELLSIRSDAVASSRLAEVSHCRIPDAFDAPRLLRAYSGSLLEESHRRLDEETGPGTLAAANLYAAIEPAALPVCVRRPLEAPNPALLVPTALRVVTLVLWARGWPPRRIVDFIRSRYEAEHGWGDLWARYDPAARADFYVRLFTDAWMAGLDDVARFTCASQQQRGGCPGGECGHELGRLAPVPASVNAMRSAS